MTENDAPTTPGASGNEETGREGSASSGSTSLPLRLLRGTAYVGAGVILLVGLAVGVLQTSWGAEQVRRIAEAQLSRVLDTQVSIDRLSGTFVSNLRAEGIQIGEDSSGATGVDILEASYSLGALLRGRVHLRRLTLIGPATTLARDSTGAWSVRGLEGLTGDTTTTRPDESTGWIVRIDRFRLQRGTASVQFASPDSAIQIRDLELSAGGLVSNSEGVRGRIDVLETRVIGFNSTHTARIRATGAVDSTGATLEEAVIRSEASRISARARLPVNEGASSGTDSVRVALELTPLALPEVGGFWPGATLPDTVRGQLTASGTWRDLQARAELRFAHGGNLNLTGSYKQGEPSTTTYRIGGEMQDFDFARLTGTESLDSHIDLRIDGTIVRRNRTLTDGHVELDAGGSSWSGRRFDRLTAGALVEDGTVEWQARLVHDRDSGAGGRLALDGTVHTDADPVTYDARGTARQFELGLWHPSLPTGTLSGELQLEGEGIDPEFATVRSGLTLAPLEVSGYYLDRLDVTARLEGGQLRGELRTETGTGRLSGRYAVDSLLVAPRFRVQEGRIERLDLSTVLRDTSMSTELHGGFSAEGRIDGSGHLQLGARIRLDSSTALGYGIDRADLELDLRNDRLQSDLQVATPYGAIDGRADLLPYADPVELSSGRIDFSRLDVGPLVADTSGASRLTGSLQVEARGSSFEDAVGRARLRIDSSRFNRQTIEAGSMVLSLDRRTAELTGDLTTPDGGLELVASAAPASPSLRYELERLDFRNLDLGAWSGSSTLETALTGRAAGWGYRVTTDSLQGQLTVHLDSSRFNAGRVSRAQLEAQIQNGSASWSGTMEGASGSATFSGRAMPFDAMPTYEVEASVTNLDALAFAGSSELGEIAEGATPLSPADTVSGTGKAPLPVSSVSGGFSLSGRGLDLGQSESEFRLWTGRALLADLRVDTLYAAGSVRLDRVTLDTVEVRSNGGDLYGGGTMALPESTLPHDLRLRVDGLQLEPFGPFAGTDQLSGGGTVEARLFGTGTAPRFDVRMDLGSVTYEEVRVASLEGRALGARTDSLLVNVRTDWESVSLPNLLIDEVRTETLIGPTSIGFTSTWAIDAQRTGSVGGRIDRRPDRSQVQLDSLTMTMGSHRWQLLKPARIHYGQAYRIENFLLHTEREQIAIDGVVDFDGSHDLIMTIEQMQIDPFADLIGYPGLGGRLSSSVVLTGPAENPHLQGELSVEELSSREQSVGRAETRFQYADYRMDVDAEIVHPDGSDLRLTGYLPADLSAGSSSPNPALAERPVDLRLEADALRIDWIDPFLDPASWQEPQGSIDGAFTISGNLGTPTLDGRLSLRQGAITLPDLGIRPQQATATVLFRDSTIVIDQASAQSGRGRANATGSVHVEDLTLGRFDLQIESTRFLAANTSDYRIASNSTLTLAGTTNRPVLGGSATLTDANFHLTESMTATELEPVELTADDLQTLESRFGIQVSETDTTTYDFYQVLQLDSLEVSFTRDVWLRSSSSPEMAIEFTGELTVVKRPNEIEQVFGTIEVVPTRSYVEQFGRRFDITTGTLTFNGAIENPILDLQAQYDVRARRGMATQASITLGLSGPLENLQFDLGSEEGLSTTEIASYLAFGRPPGQTFRGGGGSSAEEMAVDVAVGQLASLVEGLAASELGLDVVDIQYDPELGTTLTAGSYITGSIFASLSVPISVVGNSGSSTGRTRQLTLEYALTDWLLLRLQRQGGILESDLFWEYSY